MSAAIELRGVGKRYNKLEDQPTLLRSLVPIKREARHELWALRDVDLEVAQGETIGILGHNGAGKTTLLRLLAGVSRPTVGRVRVQGRIGPLISLGVGFHDEMSGRENVLLNGMLLGLDAKQVLARFDQIVEFSELEEFIDTPVKFYSSGMFMRLGFSGAIHADPQVFLLDEVLAVGGGAFQLKCFDRMREIQQSGTTILVVSHSMHAIRLLCPRAVVMRHGELDFDGSAEQAVSRHIELLSIDADDRGPARGQGAFLGGVEIVSKELVGPDGPAHHAYQDTPMCLRLRLAFEREIESPVVFFTVLAEDSTLAYQLTSAIGRPYRTYRAGETAEV